jgi:hypothetical protein
MFNAQGYGSFVIILIFEFVKVVIFGEMLIQLEQLTPSIVIVS